MLDFQTIEFIWPRLLWLLTIVPVLAVVLALVFRRSINAGGQGEFAWERAEVDLTAHAARVGVASPGGRAFRSRMLRIVPPAIWLLALTALLLAIARPQAVVAVPTRMDTVMLAIDMSGSMRAADLEPSRLAAAQAAAKSFIEAQPAWVKVGIVAVASTASVVQSPTDNREALFQALDRLQLQRGTALGSGILISLANLLPDAGLDVNGILNGRVEPKRGAARSESAAAGSSAGLSAPGGSATASAANPADGSKGAASAEPPAAEPGSNDTVAIILLSDGQSNTGPDPIKMAELAAELGVRIYTVGLGTAEGVTLRAEGWAARVKLDEPALKKIASLTGAEFFAAADSASLRKVYRQLGLRIAMQKQRPSEVTAIFVACGALLAAIAAMLSLAWFNRIV